MRTVIVCESTHQGNTRKLVDAIAEKYKVDVFDVKDAGSADLAAYDVIGLAAGIAFMKFYKATEALAKTLPAGKKVFLLYTCGKFSEMYTKSITASVEGCGCSVIGAYGCLGYDVFGPFKVVGGIAKGHPTQQEIQAAVEFYRQAVRNI